MDGQSSACHPLQAHLVLESHFPFRLILYWIRLMLYETTIEEYHGSIPAGELFWGTIRQGVPYQSYAPGDIVPAEIARLVSEDHENVRRRPCRRGAVWKSYMSLITVPPRPRLSFPHSLGLLRICAVVLCLCGAVSAQLPYMNAGPDSVFAQIDFAQLYMETTNRELQKNAKEQAQR